MDDFNSSSGSNSGRNDFNPSGFENTPEGSRNINYNTNYNYGVNSYILQFTDLTPSHWAYGHIMEATNNHRYVRAIDGNEEML